MNYTILIFEAPADFALRQDPQRQPAYAAGFGRYVQALVDAGVFVAGAGLHGGDAATTLRLRDGKRLVQDGPYADTKEQLGGFCVINVPDLDTALDWAARCPCLPNGTVEVRPNLVKPGA